MADRENAAAGRRGLAAFIAILLLCAALGAAAYLASGDKGMEERFSEALGLGGSAEESDAGGFLGFGIEGNLLAYAVILAILVVACVVLLKVFRI